jgi:hypothetical protein
MDSPCGDFVVSQLVNDSNVRGVCDSWSKVRMSLHCLSDRSPHHQAPTASGHEALLLSSEGGSILRRPRVQLVIHSLQSFHLSCMPIVGISPHHFFGDVAGDVTYRLRRRTIFKKRGYGHMAEAVRGEPGKPSGLSHSVEGYAQP